MNERNTEVFDDYDRELQNEIEALAKGEITKRIDQRLRFKLAEGQSLAANVFEPIVRLFQSSIDPRNAPADRRDTMKLLEDLGLIGDNAGDPSFLDGIRLDLAGYIQLRLRFAQLEQEVECRTGNENVSGVAVQGDSMSKATNRPPISPYDLLHGYGKMETVAYTCTYNVGATLEEEIDNMKFFNEVASSFFEVATGDGPGVSEETAKNLLALVYTNLMDLNPERILVNLDDYLPDDATSEARHSTTTMVPSSESGS